MLARRKIELRPNAAGLPQTVISRNDLIDCGLAQEILNRSQRMADDLLSQARAEAETVVDNARQAFWDIANAQLDRWQQAHTALSKCVEASAGQVVNQALHQLLEDLPPSTRISALLEHLVRAQYPPLIATLRCHPQAHAEVERWLNALPHTLWQLQVDSSLDPQALVLVTPHTDLRIDWPTALESLMVPLLGTDHRIPATE